MEGIHGSYKIRGGCFIILHSCFVDSQLTCFNWFFIKIRQCLLLNVKFAMRYYISNRCQALLLYSYILLLYILRSYLFSFIEFSYFIFYSAEASPCLSISTGNNLASNDELLHFSKHSTRNLF